MKFQPSHLSGTELLGSVYGATWKFTNVFSKEGRAENKKARAESARERAKKKGGKGKARLERKADRLEMRSSNLKKDAKGGKTIAPVFKNSAALWRVGYPFTQREKRKGLLNRTEVMRHTAKGHQPAYQLINQEYRATIAGGLYILKHAYNPETNSAGYEPFTGSDPDALVVRAKGTKEDKAFLRQVAKMAKALKKKAPKNLKEAASFIRKAVVERGLESPAWAQRALYMVGSAMKRGETSTSAVQIAGGVAAIALGTAATVVTGGAAAPLAIAAASATVAAAGAGAAGQGKAAKLGGEWDRYALEVENALKDRENKFVTAQLDRENEALEAVYADVEAAKLAQHQAIGRFLGGCLYLSLGIIGAGYVYKKAKGKKK
jgi:hypothetical protein